MLNTCELLYVGRWTRSVLFCGVLMEGFMLVPAAIKTTESDSEYSITYGAVIPGRPLGISEAMLSAERSERVFGLGRESVEKSRSRGQQARCVCRRWK